MIFNKEQMMNQIVILKKSVIEHKKFFVFCFVSMLILFIGIVFVFHNDRWYDTTIVKITDVQTSFSKESQGNHGEKEKYYNQVLNGTIMNGKLEGSKIRLKNQYSLSGVYDDQYKVGDEVFVAMHSADKDTISAHISGLKRDKYLAILFAILFLSILMVLRKKGIFVILSLAVNIFVFCYALNLYENGKDLLLLSNSMVLFFTFFSLLLISGFKRKTFAAIISTLLSIAITVLIFKLVMANTNGVDYAFMEYLVSPTDLPEIFMSQILLGGLGAIMDVTITMSSTIGELVEKNSIISIQDLIKSGREVGHDIMGTMVNVMLFTYVCGSIPMIIFKMKNDINLINIALWNMPFEWYRFLLGSIGILLSIPISLFISIILFKKVRKIV